MVVSTNSYIVDTTVDDTQVGQIKVGDQVTIQAGGSTATVYGTVSSVGLVAQSSGSGASSVASFPVVVAVTGTPSGLYAGTSATLTITTEQLNNVVEVPTSAISYSNGQATVTQVVAGSQKSVPVTTGAAASGETQITGGLKAGDVVMERVVKFNGTSSGGSPQPLRWQRHRNPHRRLHRRRVRRLAAALAAAAVAAASRGGGGRLRGSRGLTWTRSSSWRT